MPRFTASTFVLPGLTLRELSLIARGFFLDKPRTRNSYDSFCFYVLTELDGAWSPSKLVADVLNSLFCDNLFDAERVNRSYQKGIKEAEERRREVRTEYFSQN